MEPAVTRLGVVAIESITLAISRDRECRERLKQIALELISWLDRADPSQGASSTTAPAGPMQPGLHADDSPLDSLPAGQLSEAPLVLEPTARDMKPMKLRIGDHEVMVAAADEGLARQSTLAARPVGANPTVIAQPAPAWTHDSFESGPDVIAARCRLKAEACRLAGERRRRRLAGADWWDVTESIRSVIGKAKTLPGCYLWPIDPQGPRLPDDGPLAALAAGYEAMADSVEVLARGWADRELASWVEPAARLAAEAQSALRAGLLDIDLSGTDRDQQEAFRWLIELTREHTLYIDRYMRVDDQADPSAWAELRARINALSDSIKQRGQSKRERTQLFGKAKYHVNRLTGGQGTDDGADWRSLRAAVDALLAAKVPPSDAALRETLLPLVESDLELPPDYMLENTGLRQVMDHVARYVESSAPDVDARHGAGAPDPAAEYGREVAQAALLLRGRRVVMIGGEPRAPAKAALERAFGLSELDWLSAPAHSSFWNFEPAIARADTAVVLLMIRWSSHSFGEVRSICERYGKALVRLPAGYNPAQVAHQILEQCGAQLAAAAATTKADGLPAARAANDDDFPADD